MDVVKLNVVIAPYSGSYKDTYSRSLLNKNFCLEVLDNLTDEEKAKHSFDLELLKKYSDYEESCPAWDLAAWILLKGNIPGFVYTPLVLANYSKGYNGPRLDSSILEECENIPKEYQVTTTHKTQAAFQALLEKKQTRIILFTYDSWPMKGLIKHMRDWDIVVKTSLDTGGNPVFDIMSPEEALDVLRLPKKDFSYNYNGTYYGMDRVVPKLAFEPTVEDPIKSLIGLDEDVAEDFERGLLDVNKALEELSNALPVILNTPEKGTLALRCLKTIQERTALADLTLDIVSSKDDFQAHALMGLKQDAPITVADNVRVYGKGQIIMPAKTKRKDKFIRFGKVTLANRDLSEKIINAAKYYAAYDENFSDVSLKCQACGGALERYGTDLKVVPIQEDIDLRFLKKNKVPWHTFKAYLMNRFNLDTLQVVSYFEFDFKAGKSIAGTTSHKYLSTLLGRTQLLAEYSCSKCGAHTDVPADWRDSEKFTSDYMSTESYELDMDDYETLQSLYLSDPEAIVIAEEDEISDDDE